MTTDTVPQTVLFPELFDKPLFAQFNQEQASSDGGAILLKAAERMCCSQGCNSDGRANASPSTSRPPRTRSRSTFSEGPDRVRLLDKRQDEMGCTTRK